MGLSMGRREYIRLLKQKRYSIYKCKKWYVVLLGTERVRENKKENNMMCNFAPLIRMWERVCEKLVGPRNNEKNMGDFGELFGQSYKYFMLLGARSREQSINLGQNYQNIQKYMYISIGNFNPAGQVTPFASM